MSARGERLIEVVRGLIRATEAGSVNWKRTDGPETFVVSVPSGTVTVSGPRPPVLSALGYPTGRSLKIRDTHGNEVESVSLDPVRDSARPAFMGPGDEPTSNELVELDGLIERLLRLIPVSEHRSRAVVDSILRDLNAS